jgi:hypothetical protein
MTARAEAAPRASIAADPRHPAVLEIIENEQYFEVIVDGAKFAALRQLGPHAASGLLDTNRQAVEGLARQRLGVAKSDHFILRSVQLRHTTDNEFLSKAQDELIQVYVPKAGIRRRSSGECYAISGKTVCKVSGQHVAWGGGAGVFVCPESFENLRTGDERRFWGRPHSECVPLDPEVLGLDDGDDVLIGDVTVNVSHTTCRIVPSERGRYFDRPLDHYPGLMLADGARQLALLAAASRSASPVTQFACTSEAHDFLLFTELATPPTLTAETIVASPGTTRVRVLTNQHGSVRASSLFAIDQRKASPAA